MANQETQALLDHIGTIVKVNTAGLGLDAYTIQGPCSAQVLMKDRSYKTQRFETGAEIIFKGVRGGKRAQIVYEFTPVDMQPFTQIEFSDSVVFDFVQGFEAKLVEAMTGKADTEMSFVEAQRHFNRNVKKIQAEAAKEQARIRAESEKSQDAIYEANPNFGMF